MAIIWTKVVLDLGFYLPYAERHSTKRKTIEILQRTRIFKLNYRLKVHNAHLKFAAPISRYGHCNAREITLTADWGR